MTNISLGDRSHVGSEEATFGFDAVRVLDLTEYIDELVEPGTECVDNRFGWVFAVKPDVILG